MYISTFIFYKFLLLFIYLFLFAFIIFYPNNFFKFLPFPLLSLLNKFLPFFFSERNNGEIRLQQLKTFFLEYIIHLLCGIVFLFFFFALKFKMSILITVFFSLFPSFSLFRRPFVTLSDRQSFTVNYA